MGEVVKVRPHRASDNLRSYSNLRGLRCHGRMQVMGKNKVLVKVHPEGKYVVDLDKSIDIAQARCTADLCAWVCKP